MIWALRTAWLVGAWLAARLAERVEWLIPRELTIVVDASAVAFEPITIDCVQVAPARDAPIAPRQFSEKGLC